MIENFFLELSGILILATVLGIIFSKLKQPTILAFIVSGIILGASFLNIINYKELIEIFSELGIAFLLFLVGINLDTKIIKEIGKTSIIVGIGQVVFTAAIGALLALALGFGITESLYIAIALTFSSTIIIVKLLSDKNELNSLYGKISLGVLITQDFVAIIALIFVSSFSGSQDLGTALASFALNISIVYVIYFLVTKYIVKPLFDHLSKNQELLFLGAISWCFAFASATLLLGLSKEIGAFIAGVSIASLPYTYDVLGKLKYLRDFFIVLFFVVLGSNMAFTVSSALALPAIIFSVFVLIGNPIIVFAIMTWLGYKGRTSFLSSLTVAQISEFSLILIFLGEKVGQVSGEVTSIVTMTAVITIGVSSYLIMHNNSIYEKLLHLIPKSKRKNTFESDLHSAKEKKYSTVCVGFGETGQRIFPQDTPEKEKLLVVDFDPSAVKNAIKNKFHAFYGDISDLETIDFIRSVKPKIVVSTILDSRANTILANKLKARGNNTKLIAIAPNHKEAEKLKKNGIDHILVPSTISAEKIKELL